MNLWNYVIGGLFAVIASVSWGDIITGKKVSTNEATLAVGCTFAAILVWLDGVA